MANPVKYKKPRRINSVTIAVVVALLLAGYAGYQYLPLYFMRHEAYRVLEETGSEIAGRARFYSDDSPARDKIRKKMQRKVRELGIQDPDIESWIEFEGKEIRLGVLYSVWVEWPFDVVKPQESVYELEHTIVVH